MLHDVPLKKFLVESHEGMIVILVSYQAFQPPVRGVKGMFVANPVAVCSGVFKETPKVPLLIDPDVPPRLFMVGPG